MTPWAKKVVSEFYKKHPEMLPKKKPVPTETLPRRYRLERNSEGGLEVIKP
jgi:hypothetical protein